MPSPYLQAYIVTVQDGRAFLWCGMANTYERGKTEAWGAVLSLSKLPAWDSCAFPVNDGLAPGLWELQRKL